MLHICKLIEHYKVMRHSIYSIAFFGCSLECFDQAFWNYHIQGTIYRPPYAFIALRCSNDVPNMPIRSRLLHAEKIFNVNHWIPRIHSDSGHSKSRNKSRRKQSLLWVFTIHSKTHSILTHWFEFYITTTLKQLFYPSSFSLYHHHHTCYN